MLQHTKRGERAVVNDDYFKVSRDPVFTPRKAYSVVGYDPRSLPGNPLIRILDDSNRERTISGRYLNKA